VILDDLRAGTADAHARLEQRLDLLDPDLTEERYRALLERLYGFHAPLERRLAALPLPADLAAPTARPRSDLLARDLAVLAPDTAPAALPRAAEPTPADAAAALGCLYVLEGAALGGSVIAAHVRRVLRLTPETGLAFFTGDGRGTGSRWRRFRRSLELHPSAGGRPAAVVEGARATFAALEAWLVDGR
jgi:heme oxygenase